MFIESVMPISTVEKNFIEGFMLTTPIDKLPQGQYSCTGHHINLPQDSYLASELDVIVVKKDSANQYFKQTTNWKCYYTG